MEVAYKVNIGTILRRQSSKLLTESGIKRYWGAAPARTRTRETIRKYRRKGWKIDIQREKIWMISPNKNSFTTKKADSHNPPFKCSSDYLRFQTSEEKQKLLEDLVDVQELAWACSFYTIHCKTLPIPFPDLK